MKYFVIHQHPDHPGYVARLRRRAFTGAMCIAVLAFARYSDPALGQTVREFTPASTLHVAGESNKSDWTVYATEFSGNVVDGGPRSNGRIWESVVFHVSSAKMVSRKSRIMDRLMHNALKVSEYPVISFESTLITQNAKTDSSGTVGSALTVTGNLTLAGVRKPIELEVFAIPAGEQVVRFTGGHSLSMKEYGMKPPTAAFGALHTKDRVTVSFDLLVDLTDRNP